MRELLYKLLNKPFEEVLAYVREHNFTEAQMSDLMDTCGDEWYYHEDVWTAQTIQELKDFEHLLDKVYKVMDY